MPNAVLACKRKERAGGQTNMDTELEKKIKRVEPTKAESKRLYDQPLRWQSAQIQPWRIFSELFRASKSWSCFKRCGASSSYRRALLSSNF
jgi:hypothetical protein